MAKKKIRFSVIDFIIIIALVLVIFSAFARNMNVKHFNQNNYISNSVLTLSVKGVERSNYSLFSKGDTIYNSENDKMGKIGEVTGIRANPAIVVTSDETGHTLSPDFDKVDLIIDVQTRCLVDENGFFSISGVYISPAMAFAADNGEIKFDCEVVSVKTIED